MGSELLPYVGRPAQDSSAFALARTRTRLSLLWPVNCVVKPGSEA